MDVQLDPRRMEFDDDGLVDLYWPVPRADIIRTRDSFRRGYAKTLNQCANDGAEVTCLRLVSTELVLLTLTLYKARALGRRAAEDGRRVEVPDACPITAAAVEGRKADQLSHRQRLLRGKSSSKEWVPPFVRRAKWSLRWNGFNPRGFLPIAYDRDVVAIVPQDIVEQHARAVTDVVKYRPMDRWYPAVSTIDGATSPVSEETIAAVLDAIEESFDAGSESLPSPLRAYIEEWLREITAIVGVLLQRILDGGKVPQRSLWAGGGAIWTRILAEAVQRSGGEVVLHDHGNGCGHFYGHDKVLTDFMHCDKFVAFTDAVAEKYRNTATKLTWTGDVPSFTSIEEIGRRNGSAPSFENPDTLTGMEWPENIDTVLYVGTKYLGDMAYPNPLFPTPSYVDWQYRLFDCLQQWGYDPMFKPHPESTFDPPDVFADDLGVTVLRDRFERVLGEGDLLLFDMPLSSTFPVALAAERPVVLVDFGQMDISPAATELLQRRCAIVDGHEDDGRLQVDWPALSTAIESATERRDMEHVNTYLPFER